MWVLRVLFAAITAMTVVAGQGAASEYTGHVNDFERDMDFQCDTEDGKPSRHLSVTFKKKSN